MATLQVGDIRRFRDLNRGEMDGVIVNVDKTWSCYDVILVDGSQVTIGFGNIVGSAVMSAEYKRIMKLLAEEYASLKNANDLRLKYTQEANARQNHIANMRKSLRENYHK